MPPEGARTGLTRSTYRVTAERQLAEVGIPVTDRAARVDSVLAASCSAGSAEAAALRERIASFIAYPAMRSVPTEME